MIKLGDWVLEGQIFTRLTNNLIANVCHTKDPDGWELVIANEEGRQYKLDFGRDSKGAPKTMIVFSLEKAFARANQFVELPADTQKAILKGEVEF